ncbi:MAG: hypothetical protein ABI674_05345 [Spartobacteria bacterium]
MSNPEPTLTPGSILQTAFDFWSSKVLLTVVDFGLFSRLANEMVHARLFKYWHDLPSALRTGKPQNALKNGAAATEIQNFSLKSFWHQPTPRETSRLMGNSQGRDNVKKRAARRKKTERLAAAAKAVKKKSSK